MAEAGKNVRKILAIDGGGIRGILPARILQFIEERTGKPASSCFDLIAGTSTGGILALGLTLPSAANPHTPKYKAEDMLGFYFKNGPAIFHTTAWDKVLDLVRPGIDPANLEAALKTCFGGSTELKDSLIPVLIPSYDLNGIDSATKKAVGSQPIFFSSEKAKSLDGFNYLTWHVGRSTSAAPTYFPPFDMSPVGKPDYSLVNVDGGVVANNPALCAWVEGMNLFGAQQAGDGGAGGAQRCDQDPPSFLVVSIGTGELQLQLKYAAAEKWGKLQWVAPVLDILMDGACATVDHQMRTLMAPADDAASASSASYFRLQPALDKTHSDMANATPGNMASLLALTEQYLKDNTAMLEVLCARL